MFRYRMVVALAASLAVLAGSRPAAGQSSGLLASAERAVAEALVEQEEQAASVIRTPRSTRMAKLGVAVLAAGGALVLIPENSSDSYSYSYGGQTFTETYSYTDKGYLTYAGLGAMAAGGVLIWRGLGMVEVPFRVDLTTGSGFRAYRSFAW